MKTRRKVVTDDTGIAPGAESGPQNGVAARPRPLLKLLGNTGNGWVILNAGFSVDFKIIVLICLISLPTIGAICFRFLVFTFL